jgi:CRP/FNR family transcriptional regulator, cyclic AMP receptor protein
MDRPIARGLASLGSAPSGPYASSETTPIVAVRRAAKWPFRPVDHFAALRNHPLFREFPPAVIENLATYMTRRSVRRGATIFAKGDAGTALIAVLWGSVKISVSTNGGHEAVLNIINPGQAFGEIALLDGRPRTADAVAMTDCELMVIDRRDFIPVMRREPDVALKLIETLCARIRRTSEQVEDLMYLSLPARLAKTLLELTGGLEVLTTQRNVRITQQNLSNIIGMSRESTNKQLRAWQERKWVRLERGGIVLMNAGALGKLIGEEIQAIA